MRHGWLPLIGLTFLLASPAAPVLAQIPPGSGSCDGYADYADELVPSGFALVRQTALGDGYDEVEIAFELQNADIGQFNAATATPRVDDPSLGIRAESVRPADFPAIAANGLAAQTQTLQLQLPSANVADLLARLSSGARVPAPTSTCPYRPRA